MAQSNAQDRNLPASPRKLDQARREGQVARSRDFGHFAALAVAGGLLSAAAPRVAAWAKELLISGLRFDRSALLEPGAMADRLVEQVTWLLAWVVPFGVVMSVAALASSVAIGGWVWTWKPLAPKLERLDPLSGIANLVSKQKLLDAAKGSVLAIVLGAIGAAFLKSRIESLAALLALPLPAALGEVGSAIAAGLGFLLLALAAFALVDAPLQKFMHAQRLKMSHQEVKQEMKELEGNAEVKAKVRARMREMTRRRMLAAVPKADLVVMNPTHYAVALKYDDAKMAAPKVVAKGADLLAFKIRDTAKEASVPVLEAPALARALYAHAELDREIPAALFAAVAQVLAYVYQLRAALADRVAMPTAVPQVDVPAELDPHNAPSA